MSKPHELPLLPCPFCGTGTCEVVEHPDNVENAVICRNKACRARGPYRDDEPTAISVWNDGPNFNKPERLNARADQLNDEATKLEAKAAEFRRRAGERIG